MAIKDVMELVIKVTGKGSEKVDQFVDSVKRANSESDQLSHTLLSLFSTAAVVRFGRESIKVFSDLEETTAKFYEVFKGVETAADQAADTLIKRFGASELSAKSMLSQTGDLLVGFGFARDEALKMAESVAQLGSDIASFSNYAGGAEGATYAITKAMLGETEQAKMLGIAIKTDSEEYKQIYKQIKETKNVTDTQAKALTALEIAFRQKGDAIGDFERTMGSIANQGRILDTEISELQSHVGRGLQGAFREAHGAVLALVTGFNELDESQQDFIVQTGAIFSGLVAVKTAYMTNNVLMQLNNTLMGQGAVAARGLGAAMAGLAKTFLPLLAASVAIEGVLYVMNKASKEAEALAKSTGDLAKQARQMRETHEQAVPVERQMLDRYEKLVSYTDRTKEEQEELVRITEQLNAKYKGLSLSITGTADAYSRLREEQVKLAKENARKEAETAKSAAEAEINRFMKESWGYGDALVYTITGGLADDQATLNQTMKAMIGDDALSSLAEAERTLARIQSIKNDATEKGEDDLSAIAGNIEAQVKAYIAAEKNLAEIEKSGEIRNANAAMREAEVNQAVRDLRAEREKVIRDMRNDYLKQNMDPYDLVNTLGKEADALREKLSKARNRDQFNSEEEREKKLLELTKAYEKKKYEYKNALDRRLKDNHRKEKEEEIKAIEEASKAQIEALEKQAEMLEREAEARKELINTYAQSAAAYRSTMQDTISAGSEQALQMQSRMFISGGSNSMQSLQKITAENSEAQKKIMEDIKRIETDTKEKIEEIRKAIEKFNPSVA